jgi:hypothetical protein
MLAPCNLQYPLYTLMVFDELQNGIPIAFMSLEKVERVTLT